MDIADMVWNYLITLHHGSHYDWHIWVYMVQHSVTHYNSAQLRVLALLTRGGI